MALVSERTTVRADRRSIELKKSLGLRRGDAQRDGCDSKVLGRVKE